MQYISDKAIVMKPFFFGKNVYIGPYSIIGPNVEIGEDTWIDSHVLIAGSTVIGANNKIFSFSKFGGNFQHLVNGERNVNLRIGNNNVFCEKFSINRGVILTRVGDNNYFMFNSHVSNDCMLGDNIVFSNNVFISSNVFIDDFVILSTCVSVYSNVNIGLHSFIGNNSIIYNDILPYSMISGYPTFFKQLNLVGLKRYFFKKSSILRLKKIYNLIFNSNLTRKQLIVLLSSKKYFSFESDLIIKFLLKSKKSIIE